jgi:hypothetical protein
MAGPLVRQVIAKGYPNIPHTLADAALAPLRGRADYADLLWTWPTCRSSRLADLAPLA